MNSAFTEAESAAGKKSAFTGSMKLALATFALALAGLFAIAATSQAATITNPGPNDLEITSGFLKVGSEIDQSLSELEENPTLAGTIDNAGNITVPPSAFNFGTLEFEVDTSVPVLGTVQGVIGIEIKANEPVTGTVDPLTGVTTLKVNLNIRAYRISGSSLLNVGDNCRINPVKLEMSSQTGPYEGSPNSLGGRPYDVATGTARLADKTFSVPGQSGCSGLASGQINGLLGIPSGAGGNGAEFDVQFNPAPISNATLNITTKPAAATNQKDANFAFTSNVPAGLTYQCQLDTGAWAACDTKTASYTGLADGGHTFRVRAIAGGNTADPVGSTSYTWSIDTKVPEYTITGAPTGLTNSRTANLSFTVNKTMPAGATRCSLDGAPPAPCASPQNLTGLADGSHTFTVSGTDAVGNFGSSSKTWSVDATKPVVNITAGPEGVSSTSDVEFEFTATDNVAVQTVQCRIQNRRDSSLTNWVPCASPYHVNRPTGKWQLQVRATDTAGNISDVQSRDWDANTAEPVIVAEDFTFNGDPVGETTGGTISGDAEFEFRAETYELDDDDNPVPIPGTQFSYECWLDGEPLGACESPMTLVDLTGDHEPLAEGHHEFEVRPTTVATPPVVGGKTSYEWYVDTVDPTAEFTGGPGGPGDSHHNSNHPTFVLDIDGTGSQGTAQCKLDNANWQDCDSNTAHTVHVNDGPHTLLLRAIDQAGNTSPVRERKWTADTVDPTAEFVEVTVANDRSNEASFVFETNDDDNGVRALCQLDGGAEIACDSRTGHTWQGLSDGPHTFSLIAKDQAGNTTSVDHTWRVDTTAPALAITTGPDSLTRLTNAAFKFDGSDNGSGIAEVACRIDNAAWTVGANCQNGNVWNFYPGPYGSGEHNYQVRVTDRAGNSTTRSMTWKIDLDPSDVAIATALVDTKETTASVEFASSDDQALFECKLDAGSWDYCVSPHELAELDTGNHVFSVRSVDQAGNRSVEDSVAWKVLGEDPVDPVEECPEGTTGTPPDCVPVKPEPVEECEAGQLGKWPNCVTPLKPQPKPTKQISSYDPATGRLAIRLKCPNGFKPKCVGTAVAVTGKGKKAKVMSSKVKQTAKAGKWKLVTLTIKPKFRETVEKMTAVNKKQLVVRQTVKSKKKKKKNVFHTYKVRVKG